MQTLVQEFGIETVMEGIGKAGKSEFLKSGTWRVTLDWFLNPDNFQKTLEGQYDERWERHDDDMGGTDGAGGAKAGGSAELTCYLLSIIRLIHPPVLLPATTALGTIDGNCYAFVKRKDRY